MIIPRSLLDHFEEANVLAGVAGYDIVRVWRTRYTWRVGRGLVEAIAREAEKDKPSTIIFYGDPKPSTVFALTKTMRVRVVDRVALILEIFAKHAGSREALLQIEMAKIRHELPLVREWIRRSKLGELPGFLGPGGYAIDSYYRHLTSRLSKLRRELEELRKVRSIRLKARRESGMIHVAIVGYASAGKTSLFNAITGESRRVGEEYFTTLHPKHKAVQVNGVKIVFIDTVGFIRDVPPEIVEAFHSILEEIRISDVIMFVVDVSESDNIIKEKIAAGIETLARIEALGLPTVIAANKIDKVDGESLASKIKLLESAALNAGLKFKVVPTSALDYRGLGELLSTITSIIRSTEAPEKGMVELGGPEERVL